MAVQREGCPLDYPSPVDRDLQYASWHMVERYSTLTQLRGAALWCFRCLAERLQSITDHIRAQQAATLRMVNPQVHFALLALLIGILHWPDTSFCRHLFSGFPTTGYVGPCGVWDTQPASYASPADVFQQSEDDAVALAAEIQQRPIWLQKTCLSFTTPVQKMRSIIVVRSRIRLVSLACCRQAVQVD